MTASPSPFLHAGQARLGVTVILSNSACISKAFLSVILGRNLGNECYHSMQCSELTGNIPGREGARQSRQGKGLELGSVSMPDLWCRQQNMRSASGRAVSCILIYCLDFQANGYENTFMEQGSHYRVLKVEAASQLLQFFRISHWLKWKDSWRCGISVKVSCTLPLWRQGKSKPPSLPCWSCIKVISYPCTSLQMTEPLNKETSLLYN